MRRALRLLPAALIVALLAAAAGLAAIGPKRLLAWGGYAAADSRLVTGLLVAGTPAEPVLYVTSSDPRIGSGLSEEDLPLDTNSGVVSRLTRDERGWQRVDLVRGLPRSEENHATNGLALDRRRERLYVAQGGMTNRGAPSARFAYTPEYPLAGAVLELDLRAIRPPYELPTRGGDGPFGGRHGRNAAVLEPGGPVRIFATGLRNPYDLVRTSAGRLYTVDNGPAFYWGGAPDPEECPSRRPREPGLYGPDILHLLAPGYDGGHPNPARGRCRYLRGAPGRGLATFGTSTNGLAEYTAGTFGGALRGDLLAASVDQRVYRIDLDPTGSRVLATTPLFQVDGFPLDVVAQGADEVFAGTVWVADWATGDVLVYEPAGGADAARTERLASSGVARQEVSYVRLGDRFYLAGGSTAHEVYDPREDRWSRAAPLPERLDHIQGVALGGRIYYIGGLSGFPEPHAATVYAYDPETDSFSRGASMPRPRGAGGVAVHDGKLYYAGGLHEGKAVSWLDVYDPAADAWSALPDMPRARDHFQAAVVDGRLYAIGGRDTDVDAFVPETDAYDIARGEWITGLAPIPTPRGGYGATVVGDEIVVAGGEAPDRVFGNVEAYHPRTDRWRVLDAMAVPRHGIQAVACGGALYVAAGGTAPYGERPSSAHTVSYLGGGDGCGPQRRTGETPAAVRFRPQRVGAGLESPTSLQFGPDGRLYVSEQHGSIHALTLHRALDGRYRILHRERIDQIRRIPNHDDDGSSATDWRSLLRAVGDRLGICCEYPREAPPARAGGPVGPPSSERGGRLFHDTGCGGCHTLARAGSRAFSGPPLDHVAALPADAVRSAIIDPDAAIVPGYGPGRMPDDYGRALTAQELADLVAFLTRG